MNKSLFLVLVVLSSILISCSKTEVVKIGEQPSASNNAPTATTPTEAPLISNSTTPKVPAADTNTTGKTAVKCDDTDGADTTVSGRVTVTYDDGSKKDYIDECPGNGNVQTEYVCVGNDVKSKNTICKQLCVAGVCID